VIAWPRVRSLRLLVPTALLGACAAPPEIPVDAVDVRILAADTSWSASYAGPLELSAGREVHVPLGADVRLSLGSRDYISIFSAPGLGLRDIAAPGLPRELRFRATTPGVFEVRGDELCGLPHTEKARGTLIVEEAGAFRDWVREKARETRR
jgi:cytochrome c oxidase subunit II